MDGMKKEDKKKSAAFREEKKNIALFFHTHTHAHVYSLFILNLSGYFLT